VRENQTPMSLPNTFFPRRGINAPPFLNSPFFLSLLFIMVPSRRQSRDSSTTTARRMETANSDDYMFKLQEIISHG
jgi:hypothetical protein